MCSLWINPMILVAEKVFVHWKKLFKKISGLVSYNVNPHVCKNQTFLQRKVYIVLWTLISLKQFFFMFIVFWVFFVYFLQILFSFHLWKKIVKNKSPFEKTEWNYESKYCKIIFRETRPHIGNPLLLHNPENNKLFLIIYVTHFNPR